MKGKISYFALLVSLLLVGNLANGQDSLQAKPKKPRTLDDYQLRTLKNITTAGSDAESRRNKEDTMIVHADILPSCVRATYTGSARPLLQIKKEVLRQWARLYAGFPEGYTEPYDTEILFTEDGAEYWLAVRKKSLPQFERETKRSEAVELDLIRVGAAKVADKWEQMLLIESIRKAN
jgi:hypothetical protein